MANLSLSLAAGQVDTGPDKVTTGTSAPGAGDVELRISNTNIKSKLEVLRLVDEFKRFVEDGRFDSLNLV
jgi:hypothetical protein